MRTKKMESKKEQAVRLALDEANRKWAKGLFIAQNHPEYDKIMGAAFGNEGDPETVYSIASLYSDNEENDGTWEDAILDALNNEYSGYF
jgi:hypothetical protein